MARFVDILHYQLFSLIVETFDNSADNKELVIGTWILLEKMGNNNFCYIENVLNAAGECDSADGKVYLFKLGRDFR